MQNITNRNILVQKYIYIYIVYSKTPLSKNPHPTETSQLICNTTQLTGFHTIQAPTEKYFRTDHEKQINHHNVSHNTDYKSKHLTN